MNKRHARDGGRWRQMVALLFCVVAVVGLISLATSWIYHVSVVSRFVSDPSRHLPIHKLRAIQSYVGGHWYSRPVWSRGSRQQGSSITDASLTYMSHSSTLIFEAALDRHAEGDAAYRDLPAIVAEAVNHRRRGSGLALMLTCGRVSDIHVNDIDVRTIFESDDMKLIGSILISFLDDDVCMQRDAYELLAARSDLSDQLRRIVRGILARSQGCAALQEAIINE